MLIITLSIPSAGPVDVSRDMHEILEDFVHLWLHTDEFSIVVTEEPDAEPGPGTTPVP